MSRSRYPKAKELLITADCGGSNSSRTRLWKVALQDLADDLRLRLAICHFPPGTNKWNKIEHRMFCHITQNWPGRPLTSYATIVQLIGNSTTTTGLRIRAELDHHTYPVKENVTPDQMANVRLLTAAGTGYDLIRAVRAAVNDVIHFHAMSNDPASAMGAKRSQGMDGAFKAIKRVLVTVVD